MNIHTESKKSIWKGIFRIAGEITWFLFKLFSLGVSLITFGLLLPDILAIVRVNIEGNMVISGTVPSFWIYYPAVLIFCVVFWANFLVMRMLATPNSKDSDK